MEGSKIFLSCPVKTGVSLTAFLDSIFSISTDTSMERSNESARTPRKCGVISSLMFCAGSRLHINKLKNMNAFVSFYVVIIRLIYRMKYMIDIPACVGPQ